MALVQPGTHIRGRLSNPKFQNFFYSSMPDLKAQEVGARLTVRDPGPADTENSDPCKTTQRNQEGPGLLRGLETVSNHLATVTSPNSATIGCTIGLPLSLSESRPCCLLWVLRAEKMARVLGSGPGEQRWLVPTPLSPRDPGCEMGAGPGL